ncbi:unnamed protein product, partial [Scytosiphon promiscuus]
METLSDRLSILGYPKDLRMRNKPPLSRLHFAVPGGGGDGSESGGRTLFPTRRDQFLGFVALSKWLLNQLGRRAHRREHVIAEALRYADGVCLQMSFGRETSSAHNTRIGTGTPLLLLPPFSVAFPLSKPTPVSPSNLAIGSGPAVLELLGWLSKAVLNK